MPLPSATLLYLGHIELEKVVHPLKELLSVIETSRQWCGFDYPGSVIPRLPHVEQLCGRQSVFGCFRPRNWRKSEKLQSRFALEQ